MTTRKTRSTAVFVALVTAGCLIGLAPDARGASLTWTGSTAGDLMDPDNWGGATPTAGVDLDVEGNYAGEFTFPAETPDAQGGYLQSLTIRRGGGTARALNPGDGHVLRTGDLNIRYSEIFTFLSGVYDIKNTLSFGSSTSNSDLTKATVTGENTFMKAKTMTVGTGSSSVGQSRGEVTITGGAVVDATFEVGRNGGWKNSLLVTGVGTHLYSTNFTATSFVGSTNQVAPSKICYSWTNLFTVANGASYKGSTLRIGADDLTTWGNVFSVTNYATASVSHLYVYGTNKVLVADGGSLDIYNVRYLTEGSEIAVSNGVANVKSLLVGWDAAAYSVGNVFKVEEEAEVTVDTCYVFGTNAIVVSGGELVVTNAIYIGRTEKSTGGLGGSLLDVCGGRVTTKGTQSFYIGTGLRRVDEATVRVSNGGEIVMTNEANYVHVGPRGTGHTLTVTGAGSKFLHYPTTVARNVYVGTNSDTDSAASYGNTLTVSDGGYFKTGASIVVGKISTNETFAVAGGTVDIARDLKVGDSGLSSNAVFSVSGSQSRVRIGQSLQAGANSRIVFDLADAQGSAEALVQLGKAPTFASGSEIYVTSSDPQINEKLHFDCTLISCAENMDLSDVRIAFDPNVNLSRRDADNAKVLKVRCGRNRGLVMSFR